MAANTSSITQFLPEDLAAFERERPDLRVQLVEQTSADLLDAVRSGETELGIYSGFTDSAWGSVCAILGRSSCHCGPL